MAPTKVIIAKDAALISKTGKNMVHLVALSILSKVGNAGRAIKIKVEHNFRADTL